VPKAVRVHLVAKNVSHTVVGKMAVLVATNPTSLHISSTAVPSNDLGWSMFTDLVVTYANAVGIHSVEVYADDLYIGRSFLNVTKEYSVRENCSDVVVEVQDPNMVLGNPTQISARVISHSGEAVPLQPVLFSVSAVAYSGKDVTFIHTATVPLLSSLTGTILIPDFRVTTISLDIAWLDVTLASGATCKKTVQVSVARRVLGISYLHTRVVNALHQYHVMGKIEDANWNYIKPDLPLSVTVKLLRTPAYVTEHHPEEDLPTITAALISSITQAMEFSVVVSFRTYLPGTYVAVLECEGTFSNAFSLSIEKVPDIKLTVSTHALFNTFTTSALALTLPLVVQPRVMVYAGRRPISNARVIAHLVMYNLKNDTILLNPQGSSTDLALGALGNVKDPQLRPFSQRSDENGLAVFEGLSVLGALPGSRFTIFYTFGGDAATGTWDAGTFTLRPTQQVLAKVVSYPSFFAVPGMKLSRGFDVMVTYGDMSPVYRTLGIAVIDQNHNSVPNLVSMVQVSTSHVLHSGDISFDPAIPSGKYRLTMLLPGGQSPPTTTVTLTREAFSLELLTTLPTEGFIVGYSFRVLVQVRIADGAVLPNARVVAEIVRLNTSCVSTECGVLAPSSTAVSDHLGNADFTLTILHAMEGLYQLRFYTVGNGATSYDKLSGLSSVVSEVFAANQDSLRETAQGLGVDLSTVTGGITQVQRQVQNQVTVATQGSLLASYGMSATLTKLQQKSQITLTTDPFKVWNRVARIEIVRHPNPIPKRAEERNLAVARQGLFEITGKFAVTPLLRLRDRFGVPIPGKRVDILVTPIEFQVPMMFTSATGVSDENGMFEFLTLVLEQRPPAGTYDITFLCEGMSNTSRSAFTIPEVSSSDIINQYIFEIIACLAFVAAIPFFFANFPKGSLIWSVVSTGILVGVPCVPFIRKWVITNVNGTMVFLQLHLVFLILLWIVLFVGIVLITFSTYLEHAFPSVVEKYKKQRRTYIAIQYTKDIVCTRDQTQRKFSTGDVCYYPIKFLVSMTCSAVVIMVMTYFSIFIYNTILRWIMEMKNIVPRPPSNLSPSERTRLNEELIAAVVLGLKTMASMDPRLTFIEQLVPSVQSMDAFQLWQSIFTILDDMSSSVTISGHTAVILALAVVIVNVIGLILILPEKYLMVRQGKMRQEFKDRSTILLADKYIGIQCMHFVLGHQLVFFVVFFVMLILTTPSVIYWFAKAFYMTILASLISVFVTVIIEQVIVGRIIVQHRTIQFDGAYRLWTIWALIASIANGVSLTISRFVSAIVAIALLFARLDMDIFPEQMLFLDMGYWAFYSVILVDEEYNNPIALTMQAALTTEMILRRHMTGKLDVCILEGRNLVACDTFSNPDPYVIVCMEGTKQQTKVCNNTCNPKWDEVLRVMASDPQSSHLQLEVWNKNPIKDDFMGTCSLSIAELEQGVAKDIWVPLQQVTQGEICIRLTAVDFGKHRVYTKAFPREVIDECCPYPHMGQLVNCYLEELGVDFLMEHVRKPIGQRRARARWTLYMLLIRNPTLVEMRKTKKVETRSAIGKLLDSFSKDPPKDSEEWWRRMKENIVEEM